MRTFRNLMVSQALAIASILPVEGPRTGACSIELDDLSDDGGGGGMDSKSLSIAAAMDLSSAQTAAAQAQAEEAQLLAELADSEDYHTATVNQADARLNGLPALTVGTASTLVAPGTSSPLYSFDTGGGVSALADSVRLVLQHQLGELWDVLNELIDLDFVSSASVRQRAKSAIGKLFLGTEGGVVVAAVTGSFNAEQPQRRPT